MRLLHIISSVDPRGGGPIEGVKQRGLYLQRLGHEVEVLSADDPSAEWVREFPLPIHARGPGLTGYGYTPQLAAWLVEHARAYDHILINGLWQHHGASAGATLRRMGKPYHVFTHGMLDPWFNQNYPFKHLKKLVYWLLSESHTLRHASSVFFTSEEERLRARLSFPMYRVNEVVVPYGTATPPQDKAARAAQFHATHPHLNGRHLLLYLSRIHPKKGCDLLLDAFSKVAPAHPNVHLLMGGTGEPGVVAELQQQARRLGIADRISWLGMLKGDNKWAAFHAARAFVLPSHQENFGIAVAEALACGLPVLISDKVNIWREIEAAGAGFVAPDTRAGTHSSLTRWLALPDAQQQHMADAAARCFRTYYTVDAMASGLLSALQRSPHTPPE